MITPSIRHIKFHKINSTQLWLKDNAEIFLQKSPEEILIVSCQNQEEGIGRSGHIWEHSKQSLAFSFLVPPALEISLTPLEVGVLLARYFNQKFTITINLKWPNDLILQNKKCGGIICHSLSFYQHSKLIAVGVGININEEESINDKKQYPQGRTSLRITELTPDFQHEIPLDFFHYFNSHRLDSKEILSHWKNLCSHLNHKIKTHQNNQYMEGIFLEIGEKGQAIIETTSGLQEFYSGDLFYL